ncbi:MAG: hypothetical protein MZV63_23145 [Marinilabiliales bacterium]|nr:hypothetical protein [Marinilabiliales bacterium]
MFIIGDMIHGSPFSAAAVRSRRASFDSEVSWLNSLLYLPHERIDLLQVAFFFVAQENGEDFTDNAHLLSFLKTFAKLVIFPVRKFTCHQEPYLGISLHVTNKAEACFEACPACKSFLLKMAD